MKGAVKMKKNISVVFLALMLVSMIVSCSQEPKPLTMEDRRAAFFQDVKAEIDKSSASIDAEITGTTLRMIDKSQTATGLTILVKTLKKHGVWTEDSKNTLGHLGSSLMKLGFTHFVTWSSKDRTIDTYKLEMKP
jgi:hypothetical protein